MYAKFKITKNNVKAQFAINKPQIPAIFKINALDVYWGRIRGNIKNQADLQDELSKKADITFVETELNAVDARLESVEDSLPEIEEEIDKKPDRDELAQVAFTGDYNDLAVKATIGDGTLILKQNGTFIGDFKANAVNNTTWELDTPTKLSQLENDINAVNTSQLNNAVSEHNTSEDAHSYIQGLVTNLDAKYTTVTEGINSAIGNANDRITANANNITTVNNNLTALGQLVNENYDTLNGNILKTEEKLSNDLLATSNSLNLAIEQEAMTRESADNNLQSQIDSITAASDVVAIVGTYAELLQYDTTKLTLNDIIKVLNDEVHGNASSYYRWTGSAWVYIGSEGPFYTKSEANSTFVPQTRTINNKALTNNINLTASDVKALPDTTVIGNGNLTVQKNGVNIANFSANETTNVVANISVPTSVSELTNDANYITDIELTNQLAAKQDVLTAGSGIEITEDNIINSTAITNWGTIQGELSNQTDLQNALNTKQNIINDLDTIRSGASLGTTSLQSGDNITELNNNAGYLTSIPAEYVTETELSNELSTYAKKSEIPEGIIVDDAFSTTSTNAVQNKVVTAKFSEVEASIPTTTSDLINDSGFITDANLTPLRTDITSLQTDKQDKLTAGENITIENNVISATGGGGEVDLSNYYTKEETYNQEEVDNLLDEKQDVLTPTAPIRIGTTTIGEPNNISILDGKIIPTTRDIELTNSYDSSSNIVVSEVLNGSAQITSFSDALEQVPYFDIPINFSNYFTDDYSRTEAITVVLKGMTSFTSTSKYSFWFGTITDNTFKPYIVMYKQATSSAAGGVAAVLDGNFVLNDTTTNPRKFEAPALVGTSSGGSSAYGGDKQLIARVQKLTTGVLKARLEYLYNSNTQYYKYVDVPAGTWDLNDLRNCNVIRVVMTMRPVDASYCPTAVGTYAIAGGSQLDWNIESGIVTTYGISLNYDSGTLLVNDNGQLAAKPTDLTSINNQLSTLNNDVSTLADRVTTNEGDIVALETSKQNVISDLATIRTNAESGANAANTISGYGNIVTHNVSEFATSAQGNLADSALQSGDNITELVNNAGYITSIPDEYITETELSNELSTYAKKSEIPEDAIVDDAFSTISTNAVQNKVITNKLNQIEEGIAAVSFSKYDSMTTYAKDDLVTAIVDNELKVYKSLQDNNNGNPLTDANYWEEVEIAGGGTGLQMFDTILKDHILTYEESKGLALQGTYIYKDAIAGSRYGYPDFYNKVVEEKTADTVTTFEQYVQSNVSLQGNVRDNFGVLSNFSTSNYAVLPYNHAPASGDTWEFVLKITTGDDVTDTQQFVGGTEANNGGVEVAVASSRFKLWLASSASSADIASGVVGTYAVLPSTTYWVKIAFDGSAYTLSYSLDGETYIVDITVSSTTIVKGEQRSLGADAFQVNDSWFGTIDLNGCYIDVNGERQWSGVETVKVYQNANKHAFYDIAEKSKIDYIFNKYGVAWYYGVDTENERVFLPRNDYFEQLSGNPTDVGRFIEAGLPNITGYYLGSDLMGSETVEKQEGALYRNTTKTTAYNAGVDSGSSYGLGFDASRSNPIYGKSDTVQPNAVKKLLYICVGNTVSQSTITDVTEVTTTENDTLPLFTAMYFDFTPNNVSWLKAGQQQNNAGIYTFAYNELVNVLNGETKYGNLKVINESDMVSGVDYSEYWVVNQEEMYFITPTAISAQESTTAQLYFKVANAVQNIELLDVGEVMEAVADKISRQDCVAYIIESFVDGTSGYNVYSNRYCEQWGTYGTESQTGVDSNQTITLLKPYKDTNYSVMCTHQFANATYNSNAHIYSKTNTNFVFTTQKGINYWQTKGYIS